MAQKHVLDFKRIDVLAAGVEHIVGAAPEIEKAVGVAVKHVARFQPSVLEALAVDLRQAVITWRHARISNPKLAVSRGALSLSGHELDLALGPYNAATPARDGSPIDRGTDHNRAAFGETITLRYRRAESALDRVKKLARGCSGADLQSLERGKIQTCDEFALLQEESEDRRHAARMCAPIARKRMQESGRPEVGQQENCPAYGEHRFDCARHSVLVVERH